jgi:hypothetical protein
MMIPTSGSAICLFLPPDRQKWRLKEAGRLAQSGTGENPESTFPPIWIMADLFSGE